MFDCDQDRTMFLALLAGYAQQYGLSIWGYCLSGFPRATIAQGHAASLADFGKSLFTSGGFVADTRQDRYGNVTLRPYTPDFRDHGVVAVRQANRDRDIQLP